MESIYLVALKNRSTLVEKNRIFNAKNKISVSDEALKKFKERIKKTIEGHIEYVEEYDRIKKLTGFVKHPEKGMKKRRDYVIEKD